jgi:adenosine deaminase
MTAHLHIHLEPNERKRRALGKAQQRYGNAEQFFSEHALSNPNRLSVNLDDLQLFIRELHFEQRIQGVDYVELRLSPRRFLSSSVALSDVLAAANSSAVALRDPTVRLVLLINRDSNIEYVEAAETSIAAGLPSSFVGIDLAGDELRFPCVQKFQSCFHAARTAGLGITVHAGEFGKTTDIWKALDQLGAERIGHGLAAGGCRALAERLSRDGILVEMSVSSNVGLGAVPRVSAHPLPWFLERNVQVCLNTDVPLHLGTKLGDEFGLAAGLIGNGADDILRSMEEAAYMSAFSVP